MQFNNNSLKISKALNRMVKRKRTNNDLQNTKQKTKDRATRTALKTGSGIVWCSGGVTVPAPYVEPVVLLLLKTRYYMALLQFYCSLNR